MEHGVAVDHAYHVRELYSHRPIAPAGTRPRRGAVAHFYRIA